MKEKIIKLNRLPKEIKNEDDINITLYCAIIG